MPATQAASVTNRLLAALPHRDQQLFLAGCEQVELVVGTTLCGHGDAIRHVYFPTGSFISLLTPIEGHSSMEVILVGNEGMYGIPLLLGVDVPLLQAVVQGSGAAWRMDAGQFRRRLQHSAALKQLLSRYTYVLLCQLAQAAACIRFHVVEERLARWLLMTRDRAHSEGFYITHEFLARMLGVRRVGITKAAGLLQKRDLISYNRGEVRIRDGVGLEAASCSCYQTNKDTYERILHGQALYKFEGANSPSEAGRGGKAAGATYL